MNARPKYRIYLAGPMTGCNDDQKRRWRQDIINRFGNRLEFIDPLDEEFDESANASDLARADIRAIEEADGLLVNMWRESIGSAIGVVHARQKGRPVVVANPNHIRNRMLEFYADAVTDTPARAANTLLDILNFEKDWTVIKSGRRQDEQFDRGKVLSAIRIACRATRCDDILIPGMALPAIIEGLRTRSKAARKRLTSRTIHEQVLTSLDDLSRTVIDAAPVAEEWRRNHATKRRPADHTPVSPASPDGAVSVEIRAAKSHATIWGTTVRKLDDIPSQPARDILMNIQSVPGITRIVLGPFGHKGSRSRSCALVRHSPTPLVIEGILYDRGRKGTMQTFQVRIQADGHKQGIIEQIEARLRRADLWAE